MTIDTDTDYEVIDVEDLEELHRNIKIDSRTSMHNTDSEREAMRFIRSLPEDTKIDVFVHYDVGVNVKDLSDITVSYLLDELRETHQSLSDYAYTNHSAYVGIEGKQDFFQIITHKRGRDGIYQ